MNFSFLGIILGVFSIGNGRGTSNYRKGTLMFAFKRFAFARCAVVLIVIFDHFVGGESRRLDRICRGTFAFD